MIARDSTFRSTTNDLDFLLLLERVSEGVLPV